MTCKDCIHYAACMQYITFAGSKFAQNFDQSDILCDTFEDKSRFIETPCKVGDTVYQVDTERIYESTVKRIIYDTDGIAFDERAIGKTVFLSREEAEKALKEREQK